MAAVVHEHLAERAVLPSEYLVDAGYVTAVHLLAARDDHGIVLVGPVGVDTHHGTGNDKSGTVDLSQRAFTVDFSAKFSVLS
ncbi:hypothetical protein [Streptomyces sp. KR55]|uniref:hypothetical protein n=1 Tax=Streptomyces sp. KR55 TaxID=3457425 RepID=UPI003FD029D1